MLKFVERFGVKVKFFGNADQAVVAQDCCKDGFELWGRDVQKGREILDTRGRQQRIAVEGKQALFESDVFLVALGLVCGKTQEVLVRREMALLEEGL